MKFFILGIAVILTGCGPHHVAPTTVPVIKYQCVNWLQTIAICDTAQECNAICEKEKNK